MIERRTWGQLFASSTVVAFLLAAFLPLAQANELVELAQALQDKKARWTARETSVSKLAEGERKNRLGVNIQLSSAPDEFLPLSSDALPPVFDWRNLQDASYVTPVKDQGSCGACWAFAATAALESKLLMSPDIPLFDVDLSEQSVISCGNAGSCVNGGTVDLAFDFIRDQGLPEENCFPYVATDAFCGNNCLDLRYGISGWHWVEPSENAIKQALYTYGPLVANMAVYTDFFYYGSGIYSHVWGEPEGYHAVLLVGYNDNERYFMVKDSWGQNWGESGYFKIAYSEITSDVAFGFWTIAYDNAYIFDSPGKESVEDSKDNGGNDIDSTGNAKNESRKGSKKQKDARDIASLSGLVSDSTDKPIEGVTISIGKTSVATDSQGKYSLENLSSGKKIAILKKDGYCQSMESIELPAGAQLTKNFTLTGAPSGSKKTPGATPKAGQAPIKENDPEDNKKGPELSPGGPGWFSVTAPPVSHEEAKRYSGIRAKELAASGAIDGLGAETFATPEIEELARALWYDPKLIYDYVHNHIDYVPYYGSTKGATLTYFDGSGNDFDQASLMIALLRESKSYNSSIGTVQYGFGTMNIPISQLSNWLGVDPDKEAIGTVIASGGIPVSLYTNTTFATVTRVWVKATINGITYVFDPAFKTYAYKGKIDIGSAMGYNQGSFLSAAMQGATVTADYSKSMNEANVKSSLTTYSKNLVAAIRGNYPNYSVDEVISGRSIVQEKLDDYPTSLPFTPTTSETWDSVPQDLTATVRIKYAGIDYAFNTPELSGSRLVLVYNSSGYPQLYREGSLVATGTIAISAGNKSYPFVLKIDHPYPANSGTYCDQTSTQKPEGGRTYAVVCNFGGVADTLLQKRQRILDQYVAQEGPSSTSEKVLGETLNIMGLMWTREVMQYSRLLSASADTVNIGHHQFGLKAQEAGYYIDMPLGLASIVSKHNNSNSAADAQAHFKAMNLFASALEHGVLEQLMGTDNPGVSTMKLFQIANSNSTYGRVFMADSSNYSTGINVRSQLVNYTDPEKEDFQNQINNGDTLILPENGQLVLGDWKGKGYITKYFTADYWRMGMIIGGGLNGGYSSYEGVVKSSTVSSNTAPASYYNNYSSSTSYYQSSYSTPTSKDPVDLAGGAFVFEHTDLAIGDAAPRGLSFARLYSSNRNLTKTSLGYGWRHNYDISIGVSSHADPCLGMRQPVDAAALISVAYVSFDLMRSRDDIQGWMTASLSAKWGVDQLLDNAATVYAGNKVMEYVKLADGTYAEPPGQTTKLVNSSGTFSLNERFGTVTKFNTSNKIESLTDVDGNKLSFTYSGTNLTQVTDTFGRKLILGYDSSSRVNAVTEYDKDNILVRSVSYTYNSTTGDLLTYTDPESKIWKYGYDGYHRLKTLTNPLTIVTATNTYDLLGRVKTQTVPRQNGATAKYRFYISGYRNAEVDPDGNSTVYYFDDKGRNIGVEDALGNTFSRVFDGQDHVVQEKDARLNSTYYKYDKNKNVTSFTNQNNEKTIYGYDSNLRRTDVWDPAPYSHNTHYDYDAEHHLTMTTDELGYYTESIYYANADGLWDGLMKTTWDKRRTATKILTYDSYGKPETTQTGSHPILQTTYDSDGRMTNLIDQEDASTQFKYDRRSLLKKKTDPLNYSTNYVYDDAGRLSTITDRKSQLIQLTYTPSDKLETITYPDLSEVNFTYNNLDQRIGMTDKIGATSYSYYDDGRLKSLTNPYSASLVVGYTKYDANGNLTELTYPGNKKVYYEYDKLNRLQKVTNWLSQEARYTYEDGMLKTFTNFNGIVTTYTYDGAHRLTSIAIPGVASYVFTLDANSNRTSIVRTEPLSPAQGAIETEYTYNTKKNRLMSAGPDSFGYDNEGQLKSGYGSTYTFDYEHRLTGDGSNTYFYDGDDNRLQAKRSGVTTRYIYDASGNLLAEANGSNTITKYYIHGMGLLAMVTPAGQTYCYHFDATGSTIAMTNQSKSMVNKYAYDSFGNVIDQVEGVAQPFMFVGQYGVMAEPNGFYYMRARYYDPQVGRFISEDPSGFEGGDVNLYAYVQNNPVNGIDPSGLWVLDVNFTGGAGGGGTMGCQVGSTGANCYWGVGASTAGSSFSITLNPWDNPNRPGLDAYMTLSGGNGIWGASVQASNFNFSTRPATASVPGVSFGWGLGASFSAGVKYTTTIWDSSSSLNSSVDSRIDSSMRSTSFK